MNLQLVFPEGVSKYGAFEDMNVELGNYAQESPLSKLKHG